MTAPLGEARPIPAGLTRVWQNAETYRRRTVVPGRWHAFDIDAEAARFDDNHLRFHQATALCGKVDNVAMHHTEPDPLTLRGQPKAWRKVCVKCAKAAGRPIAPKPIALKEEPVTEPKDPLEPTPGPAEPSGMRILDLGQLPRLMLERDLYFAIAIALLEDDADAIQYLRGIARVGMLGDKGEAGPTVEQDGQESVDTHRRVMATLERLGVEPLDEETVKLNMMAAAKHASEAFGKLQAAAKRAEEAPPATAPERPLTN